MRRQAVVLAIVLGATTAPSDQAQSLQPEPTGRQARMAGGGWITGGTGKVTLGVHLLCETVASSSNNLEINSDGVRFHLDSVTEVQCSASGDRKGGGSISGHATGRCNGQFAAIEFAFSDSGDRASEAGDRVAVTVNGLPTGPCATAIGGRLQGGNIRFFHEVDQTPDPTRSMNKGGAR
jgi:hypothetical protein